jgi:hypothetical protein
MISGLQRTSKALLSPRILLHFGILPRSMTAQGHEHRFCDVLRHVRSTTNTHRDNGHPKSAVTCQLLPHRINTLSAERPLLAPRNWC